jgi:glycosyltransferase involved in cell wall biosynthesis
VDAVAALKREGKIVSLVVLGKDRSRSQAYKKLLEEKIRAAGLEKNIFLSGDNPNPMAVYAEFDVFALPTHWEGCARTLLEAMLARCPIVTTDAGGNPEIITHNQSGLLVKPGDVSALAAALKTLLEDRALAEKLLNRLTLERHVAAVREVYQDALA